MLEISFLNFLKAIFAPSAVANPILWEGTGLRGNGGAVGGRGIKHYGMA